MKQGRQIGLTMPFIGCDGWANQALLTIGGKAMNGCFFTNHFSPDDQSPNVKSFVAKYQEKYGSQPDTFSALGYDAARLLADAIKRAGNFKSLSHCEIRSPKRPDSKASPARYHSMPIETLPNPV